jgi:phenylalanyl-tRNA synthetase beta chain
VPVITLKNKRFSKFAGRKLTTAEMVKWLPWLGFDIEEEGEDYVKIEFNPNRIDFCSYAGIARAYKGLRGWQVGLAEYHTEPSTTTLVIDKAVMKVRPYMLGAIVRNMQLDEDDIVDLMEMQEDLHWGIGRDRKKASIGVHNLDAVEPPFTFTASKPEDASFVPLGEAEKMNLREVLEKNEKGRMYSELVDWAPSYPLLIDKNGNVLSMPPIINGELTKVDGNTRNLFLDVTGTDYVAVNKSLNVLSTSLADMGGTLERVQVECNTKTIFSPELDCQEMTLHSSIANKALGLRLSDSTIVQCLQKCRLGTRRTDKGIIEVSVPAYRVDILHEIDLVEEVAIGYGYFKLKPTFPSSVTIGKSHAISKTAHLARQIMIGLGFTEAMNFTITSEKLHYVKMRRKIETPIKIANPISSEFTIMRHDLLPSLMKNLADNKHESFPQRLFEVSDVMKLNSALESQCERRLHVAAVASHSAASYSEMKSNAVALMENLGLKRWKLQELEDSSFIKGRVVTVRVGKKIVGIIGEIHPEVLNNFQLENPTAAFEFDINNLEI